MNPFNFCYLAVVFAALYLPILMLMGFSFNHSKYGFRWEGFTWGWYSNLAADTALIEATVNSFIIASLSATLACVMGTISAIALQRNPFWGSGLVRGLLGVTLLSPDIVMAVSLLILFIFLHIKLGFWALLLSHITFSLPFITLTILARLQDFDRHLMEAALDLGATDLKALLQVLIPLAAPAIIASWLLGFTLSLDDVVISFFVTGPDYEVLPLRIYSMVRMGVKPEVNALATLLFGLSLVLVVSAQWLLKGKLR